MNRAVPSRVTSGRQSETIFSAITAGVVNALRSSPGKGGGAHPCADRAGTEKIDLQIGRRVFRSPCARHRVERRFGGRIGSPIGLAGRGRARSDAARRARNPDFCSSGSMQRINCQLAVTLTAISSVHAFGSTSRERRERAEQGGVGDHDIELAETLVERGTKPCDAVEILQVERYERGGATGLLDLVVEFLEAADGARQRHDMRARLRERERGREADPARSAGDERDTAGKRLATFNLSFVMPGVVPGIHAFSAV